MIHLIHNWSIWVTLRRDCYEAQDGEIYVNIGDESAYSICLNKNGTWSLQ